MTEPNEIQIALQRLKLRLAGGEISRDEYRDLLAEITAGLSDDELAALGVTPPPVSGAPSAVRPGPSGGAGSGARTRLPQLSDHQLDPGTVLLGQWRIVRELGRGGFGAVFEAEEIHLAQRHAVKVLDPSMVVNQDLLARFRREVSVMRGLAHPRIVRVFDYREDPDERLALISMDYVEGCSVRGLLDAARAQRTPVPIQLARAIFEQTLEALAAAHAEGIIHRDVTPGNILLSGGTAEQLLEPGGRDPRVKLVDFGIAALAERSKLSSRSHAMGTTAFVAPEVLDPDAEITSKADLYGAGAVAYELLAGKPPLVTGHRPVGDLREGVPAELAAVIMESISSDPSLRPDSAGALRRLHASAEGPPSRAAEPESTGTDAEDGGTTDDDGRGAPGAPRRGAGGAPPSRRPSRVLVVLLIVAAVAVGIGAVMWLMRGGGDGHGDRIAASDLERTPTPESAELEPAAERTPVPGVASPAAAATDVPRTSTPIVVAPTATSVPPTPRPTAVEPATPAVQSLTDTELLDRIVQVGRKLGQEVTRQPFELALQAEPACVLLGGTPDFFGTLNVTASAWVQVQRGVMPAASCYGTRLLELVLDDILAGSGGGQGDAQAEAGEMSSELLRRAAERARDRKREIDELLRKHHPELQSRQQLLAAVLGWASAGGPAELDKLLDRAASVIARMQRGPGYSGHWYGVVSQDMPWEGAGTLGYNLFAQALVEANGDEIRGGGRLGNGNEISFTGRVDGDSFTGKLLNASIGLESELTGRFSDTSFIVDYEAQGPDGSTVRGRAVMVR